MKALILGMVIIASALEGSVFADVTLDPTQLYRELTLRIRGQASFRVPMPNGTDMMFSYELKTGTPKFQLPLFSDFYLNSGTDQFFRNFWDKVYLLDGSSLQIGAEKIPLTCIFVHGQDNRFTKKDTPLLPDFVLKVYLVANDYTCTGPINPGWPGNGLKKETWDTYLYFEIRDPTIMLPTETEIRYRWAEYPAYLVDQGGGGL